MIDELDEDGAVRAHEAVTASDYSRFDHGEQAKQTVKAKQSYATIQIGQQLTEPPGTLELVTLISALLAYPWFLSHPALEPVGGLPRRRRRGEGGGTCVARPSTPRRAAHSNPTLLATKSYATPHFRVV
ncbi:unnamed protein product [Pieris brassicae]|uniref:Uncharacterized protein n=1 Tax=Pieris brassicae TaxID=7116 RepID=A0A9P0TNG8_PIEBR|nr:unnamed protein product [Pieris brassicae]